MGEIVVSTHLVVLFELVKVGDVLRPGHQLREHLPLRDVVADVVHETLVHPEVVAVLPPSARLVGAGGGAALGDILRLQYPLHRHVPLPSRRRRLHLVLPSPGSPAALAVPRLPPALGPVPLLLHRLALHARRQALHVAAVLAAVPLPLVDHAVAVLPAGVRQLLAHRALEEALAPLAGVNAVVLAGGAVAADGAEVLGPGQRGVVGRGGTRTRGLEWK